MHTHMQVRNVPDAVHRVLKSRAALAGLSLSDYLRIELERIAEVPTMDEFRKMLAQQPPVQLQAGAASFLYEIREEREQQLAAEPPPPPYETGRKP